MTTSSFEFSRVLSIFYKCFNDNIAYVISFTHVRENYKWVSALNIARMDDVHERQN